MKKLTCQRIEKDLQKAITFSIFDEFCPFNNAYCNSNCVAFEWIDEEKNEALLHCFGISVKIIRKGGDKNE